MCADVAPRSCLPTNQHYSTPEPILVVPLQVFPPGPMLGAPGNPQLRPLELVVVLPVVEVRVDAVADLEVVVRL